VQNTPSERGHHHNLTSQQLLFFETRELPGQIL
jgi:hypothetical protein